MPEVADIRSVACTPSGYYHGRARALGFACAAVSRTGALYTWGNNVFGQLLHAPAPAGSRRPADYFVARAAAS